MANQFENLKKVHELQKEGVFVNFLNEIKGLKESLDSFSSTLKDRKNEINLQEAQKKLQIEKEVEAKVEAEKKEVAQKEQKQIEKVEIKKEPPVFSKDIMNEIIKKDAPLPKQNTFKNDFRNQNNTKRIFENQNRNNNYNGDNNQQNRQYNNQSRFNNQDRQRQFNNTNAAQGYNQNGQRPFNNNGQRPYNNQNGQQRPYNNYNQNAQRPYNNQNGQQRSYNNNGQRPFNNQNGQRSYNSNGQRPFNNQNGFVSTAANGFKKFDIPDTNIIQTERNFGNKNKSPDRNKNLPEERKSQLRRTQDSGKNSFISYDGNFEETTMGSRKIINRNKKKEEVQVAPAVFNIVLTSKNILVKELSEKTKKPVAEIVKQLMLLGIMANINSTIDFETAELVCGELGVEVELKIDKTMEEKLAEKASLTDSANNKKRPPIVTVMGHVDHGKTSLLDAFRNTSLVSAEAGGITQSIGAYQISFKNEKITFIDTPGHAAFTAMRARGAKATDIAILVVAADDGIMPQTIEAISHIKAANVPMIVAINKMDKPEANPEKIKQQLAEHDVLPEEWGGDAIIVPCSARTGEGLDKLKETILLIAEMEDIKADASLKATGFVLEANLDKGRGPVANIIVQNGTLKVGDSVMSGITFGKVRAMFDENGKPVKEAGPSSPITVLGLNEVPSSGDIMYAIEDSLSKQVIQERVAKIKESRSAQTSGATLDDFMQRVQEGNLKNLNVIIKADTQGSVEALTSTLLAIRNEEAKVNIVHKAVGAVTESDVILAQTTSSVLIVFNQKTMAKVQSMADSAKVEIKEYKIIYEIIDDLTNVLSGMLTVKYEEKYIGKAEVLAVFKLSSVGKVAGCQVKDGKATRVSIVKVLRDDQELGSSTIESLKIVKDEKSEVLKGFECGIKLKDNIEFKEGDSFEFYVKEVVKRS